MVVPGKHEGLGLRQVLERQLMRKRYSVKAFSPVHLHDNKRPQTHAYFPVYSPLQASYIAHDMPMAPHSRLGDGLIDLFFIKKGASRLAMIQVSNH